ncbi:MAG: hydantoinase/oxoprolinase family protein [Ahrensia sp.]|nr:hydantoinase/oxoprolinase family protein [Ahrensia sp.]
MPHSKNLRLATDIGGTFTDTVLVQDETILASAKTLTTQKDPAKAALQGAAIVLKQSGHSLGDVSGFIHGTTLATNALIERRGAKVGTITTHGFRDILEIAYERRYSQYDIGLVKPDLLVERDQAFTVLERMSVDGKPLIELTEKAVEELLAQLEKIDAQTIAICLLHAYANPTHERHLRDVLKSRRPDLDVSLSCEVSPEAREFDRLCTTVANAYIQPLMSGYLRSFAERFAKEGLICPILMMTAGGGMCTIEAACRFPIRLVESGPAGGAILAARIAEQAGLDQVLSFDVGGTTAKLCLIDKATPQTARQFEIARAERFIKGSGMPVRIPVIDMIEIGAGGGSIATVDRLGRLKVGPQSAGSDPGPAAFLQGGQEPTVTDADIALGYIVPDSFAEGRVAVDADAARNILSEKIGSALALDATTAADGVSRMVDESMASAGRMHAVESGKDLGDRTMIAFGGNGPLHATRVARSAGVSTILIPTSPGVGSAVGFLHAPVSFEIVRSHYSLLETVDFNSLNALLDSMAKEASDIVVQAALSAKLVEHRTAFMRYSGQGHEIEIELPNRALKQDDIGALTNAFEAEYSKQFSRPVPGMEIEILNWGVRIATAKQVPPRPGKISTTRPVAFERSQAIHCDLEGRPRKAALVPRAELRPGDTLEGPALIVEPQTTTLVSADFRAHVDAMGNLVLTQKSKGAKR